jgi:hypothetical protein
MRENRLQEKFTKLLKKHGMLVYKVEAVEQPGFPDLLVVPPSGRIFLIEAKKPRTGRLRGMQDYTINDELRPQGVTVYVCNSIEQAQEIIREQSGPGAAAGD